jgi:hypothetical protein
MMMLVDGDKTTYGKFSTIDDSRGDWHETELRAVPQEEVEVLAELTGWEPSVAMRFATVVTNLPDGLREFMTSLPSTLLSRLSQVTADMPSDLEAIRIITAFCHFTARLLRDWVEAGRPDRPGLFSEAWEELRRLAGVSADRAIEADAMWLLAPLAWFAEEGLVRVLAARSECMRRCADAAERGRDDELLADWAT